MNFPALELIWSPTGLGSVVNGHSWPMGTLQAIDEAGLTFGIEGQVRLRYPPSSEGREICKIDRHDGRIRLWHLIKRHHCGVNGRAVEERELELHHRDLLAMPGPGPVFRVLESPLAAARSATLEAAIRAAPADRELVKVYSDFLLDHGDPLGERLSRARSTASSDDATWLDVLATHYEAGRLEIEWQHGFAAKVVLRDALLWFKTLEQAVAHLASLPVMRFLRELTLDVASDRLSVADGLHALAHVTLPETVQRVSLGDVPEYERHRVERLLDAAPGRVQVGFYTDAMLEVLRSVRTEGEALLKTGDNLTIGNQLLLGDTGVTSMLNQNVLLAGSHLIARDGPRYVLARIVHDAELAKVNGRVVDRFPLRDGDVIELPGELTARFHLRR